ncbi:uncharacterized protein LOC6729131 [Drosophila simulans]|uniref:GD20967 n=1 Tax=Drosophila simulans TaxID=7240 RepID=B4R0N2_DROSI|nr:uncharacterized protein LOC6729131 [Drosophila simulans]EDX13955.1 GD20967 [Drosophila simulans]KMZ05148.1 uncharacterized protein Dsimw501_GD20967 [Drosophila simulans]
MIAKLKQQYAERWHYPPSVPPAKLRYVACGKVAFYGHNDKPKYKPCWQHPLNVQDQARFGVCWEYPPERYKRRPLPPPCRGSTIPIHLLKPTFKHCENIYSRYDFRLEQCVHEQTLVVDQKMKALKNELEQAKPFQIEKVKEMRYHGVRYRILASSTGCTKTYPEYISRMTEERALCEFQRAYNFVNQSHTDLSNLYLDMSESKKELDQRVARLDRSLDSTFLKELVSVLQIIEDLNTYFFGVIVKLKTWAELMDPMKEHSIEDYLGLLCQETDFRTFMSAGIENCTCKRCDKKDPLKPYLPCWCQMESSEDVTNLKNFDDDCPKNIAGITQHESDIVTPSDTSLLVRAADEKARLAANQAD